jgi:hypothetical protein
MCQPLCWIGPWEYMAVGRGLITVPGIVITLYGIVLIIYISQHIYANFLTALAGLVGLGPDQHEDYASGICPSAVVLYLASFPYPVSLTPILVLCCQTQSGLQTRLRCCFWPPLSTMAVRAWHRHCPLHVHEVQIEIATNQRTWRPRRALSSPVASLPYLALFPRNLVSNGLANAALVSLLHCAGVLARIALGVSPAPCCCLLRRCASLPSLRWHLHPRFAGLVTRITPALPSALQTGICPITTQS